MGYLLERSLESHIPKQMCGLWEYHEQAIVENFAKNLTDSAKFLVKFRGCSATNLPGYPLISKHKGDQGACLMGTEGLCSAALTKGFSSRRARVRAVGLARRAVAAAGLLA